MRDPYVNRITGLPPEVPAALANLFQNGKEYLRQSAEIYDTFPVLGPGEVGSTDLSLYPPNLRVVKYFERAKGSLLPAPLSRAKDYFDTNLQQDKIIPFDTVMRVDEIIFRACPISPAVTRKQLKSLYWWYQSVFKFKIQENERFQFRGADCSAAGNPMLIPGIYHDPDDSELFNLAGETAQVHGLGGFAANGFVLSGQELWLRPGIQFEVEQILSNYPTWVLEAFFDGDGDNEPDWCAARLELILRGVIYTPAEKL